MTPNEGFRPGSLKDSDKVRVKIAYNGVLQEVPRVWPARTCYWGKDRPVTIEAWEPCQ